MTLLAERPGIIGPDEPDHPGAEDFHHPHEEGPTGILKWLTSTDHKVIGKSYMITSLILFFIAGLMAMVIRGQLMQPSGLGISFQTYNQLFTMHGSLMMYLFAGPFAFGGLANFILPLQVGAPDMAFPRLNALSYWLYLTGSITMLSGFLVTGGAASFGWVAYAPLSNATNTPGAGADLWLMALALTGFSAIFTGVNLVATVFYLRAPGMTMFRVPIFSWNMMVTGILILIAFPVLFAAVVMLFCDRHFGTHIFTVSGRWFTRALATPLLVLRTPGGVHPGLALLRDRDRHLPGLLPEAPVRLPGHGLCHHVASPPCPRASGPTTCSPPAWCCCRSSRSCPT